MKQKILFLSLLLIFGCESLTEEEKKINEIVSSFELFKKVINERNGHEGVRYLDRNTKRYYSELLDLIKNSKQEDLEKHFEQSPQPFIDKKIVFFSRHMIEHDKLKSMNLKKFLEWWIDSGMLINDAILKSTFYRIDHFVKDGAVTYLKYKFARGKSVILWTEFYKEDEIWKINYASLFNDMEKAYKKVVKDSKKSLDEYIFTELERISSRKIDLERLWHPIN